MEQIELTVEQDDAIAAFAAQIRSVTDVDQLQAIAIELCELYERQRAATRWALRHRLNGGDMMGTRPEQPPA